MIIAPDPLLEYLTRKLSSSDLEAAQDALAPFYNRAIQADDASPYRLGHHSRFPIDVPAMVLRVINRSLKPDPEARLVSALSCTYPIPPPSYLDDGEYRGFAKTDAYQQCVRTFMRDGLAQSLRVDRGWEYCLKRQLQDPVNGLLTDDMPRITREIQWALEDSPLGKCLPAMLKRTLPPEFPDWRATFIPTLTMEFYLHVMVMTGGQLATDMASLLTLLDLFIPVAPLKHEPHTWLVLFA